MKKGTAKNASAGLKDGDTLFDVKGQYVMPGFIDVHTHGALTYDFCDKDPQAVFEVAKAKLQEGVTTFLPTTLTVSHGELMTAVNNAKKYAEAGQPFANCLASILRGRSQCEVLRRAEPEVRRSLT